MCLFLGKRLAVDGNSRCKVRTWVCAGLVSLSAGVDRHDKKLVWLHVVRCDGVYLCYGSGLRLSLNFALCPTSTAVRSKGAYQS